MKLFFVLSSILCAVERITKNEEDGTNPLTMPLHKVEKIDSEIVGRKYDFHFMLPKCGERGGLYILQFAFALMEIRMQGDILWDLRLKLWQEPIGDKEGLGKK